MAMGIRGGRGFAGVISTYLFPLHETLEVTTVTSSSSCSEAVCGTAVGGGDEGGVESSTGYVVNIVILID